MREGRRADEAENRISVWWRRAESLLGPQEINQLELERDGGRRVCT